LEWDDIPFGSTKIYISREWAGLNHPDPKGTQTYHLLRMFQRLQKGDIRRTDMDTFHMLLYKHKYTTLSNEWSRTFFYPSFISYTRTCTHTHTFTGVLSPEKTFIWYDICCIPENQVNSYQDTFECIKACDFTIILAPGCTHSDIIDPLTQRKLNMCYRTYRLSARCVYEMFCAFLSTKGGKRARPMLLVRSASGTPNWISPLECQKLKLGMSKFRCCETNHTIAKSCIRLEAEKNLARIIDIRVESLFEAGRYEEARMTISLKQWWLRGFENHLKERKKVSSEIFKKEILRYYSPLDGEFFDRCKYSVLLYAALSNRPRVVKEILDSIPKDIDDTLRAFYIRSSIPDVGLSCLGFTGGAYFFFSILVSLSLSFTHIYIHTPSSHLPKLTRRIHTHTGTTALHCAMSGASWEVVTLLLEYGADP